MRPHLRGSWLGGSTQIPTGVRLHDRSAENYKDRIAAERSYSFKGGIHVRKFVGGVGAPVGGRLEVDKHRLRFHGLGLDVRIPREKVKAVRFGPGINATRISAILLEPSQEQFVWLSTRHPEVIRNALQELSWPIVDDPSFDLGVAEEFNEG